MSDVTVYDRETQTWVTLSVSRIADMMARLMEHQPGYSSPLLQELLAQHENAVQQPQPESPTKLKDPCRNCLTPTHDTKDCKEPCGHCGQQWHTHDLCTSIPRNHCKCRPFPQRHLARRCTIVCTSDCPKIKTDQPGSEYHRNAMTCKKRCCMCGLYSHAGRDCHLRWCRCGTEHLAIDHPLEQRKCVISGCPRWFCNEHYQQCSAVLVERRRPECSIQEGETVEEDPHQLANVNAGAAERNAAPGV